MDVDQKAQSVPNVENYYFFLYIWTSYIASIASTPDWVTEFAEKQARQEQEDKIKVFVK